jgi:hypothetical protein
VGNSLLTVYYDYSGIYQRIYISILSIIERIFFKGGGIILDTKSIPWRQSSNTGKRGQELNCIMWSGCLREHSNKIYNIMSDFKYFKCISNYGNMPLKEILTMIGQLDELFTNLTLSFVHCLSSTYTDRRFSRSMSIRMRIGLVCCVVRSEEAVLWRRRQKALALPLSQQMLHDENSSLPALNISLNFVAMVICI